MDDFTANEGDTVDIIVSDAAIRGTPITDSNPPDTLEFELWDRSGRIDNGTLVDATYLAADVAWRFTVLMPTNRSYAVIKVFMTKAGGRKSWKIPIFVEQV